MEKFKEKATELCPFCGEETEMERMVDFCESCGKAIVCCSMCPSGYENCSECEYSKKARKINE